MKFSVAPVAVIDEAEAALRTGGVASNVSPFIPKM